jgi:hypothetical protein
MIANGMRTAALFYDPHNVALDLSGIVYIADALNNRIQMIYLSGNGTTLASSGFASYVDGLSLFFQYVSGLL